MKSIIRIVAATAAVFTLAAAHGADDDFLSDDEGEAIEDGAGEEGAAEDASAAPAAGAAKASKKDTDRIFHLIPYCRDLEGRADVKLPNSTEWQSVVEGRYYPLGSIFRTASSASRLKIKFGPDSEVFVRGVASFGTRVEKLGEKKRAINLISGTVTVKLPANMPEGWFTVNAPGFSVTSAVGESRYTYRKTGDGDEALVRCVTQTMTVEGPHFKAVSMKAADEMLIRTSEDQLLTVLNGKRGDILMLLDQGLVQDKDLATGEKKVKEKKLEWRLSPMTTVRIHRAKPKIGKNLAVTTMTFDSRGELRNRCAFAENMVEVNSGEIGPTTRKEREELAKKAAQIAEQQAAETEDVDDAGAEDDVVGAAEEESSSSDDSEELDF